MQSSVLRQNWIQNVPPAILHQSLCRRWTKCLTATRSPCYLVAACLDFQKTSLVTHCSSHPADLLHWHEQQLLEQPQPQRH